MYAIRRHRAAKEAWCWRVHFKRRGKAYSKTFYDLTCGGSKQAKAEAVAWRDDQLAKLKAFTLVEFRQQKRSNNVSGVTGVHFHKTPAQPLGFWQASIRFHDGKRTARSFSVLKFGRQEAYRRAVAARLEMLEKVENRPYLYDPVAKRFVKQE
ncbi:MAG: AP2 domain-containing protein [Burkholderiales bacterium]|nr:AP2 domain-containing protein [Burkholderiales bacterium]